MSFSSPHTYMSHPPHTQLSSSTRNIIANARHVWLDECAVRAMRKKVKSDIGDCGTKKCRRGYSGVWLGLRLVEIWSLESGGRFCVGVFGRNLASVAVKMFPHLILLFKTIRKFCTLNVICKTNDIICITVKHREGLFPSTFNGHALFLVLIG
jgi:hypothetical protein